VVADRALVAERDHDGARGPSASSSPSEDAVDLGDELQTQAGTLALVPDRGFLELRLRDRLDAKIFHGFRGCIAFTAARAHAIDSVRENPVLRSESALFARCTISASSSGASVRRPQQDSQRLAGTSDPSRQRRRWALAFAVLALVLGATISLLVLR
jgi:hypothetical protein